MLNIGPYHFAPRPWAIGLYLLVLCLMLALGRWQLQRADEKIALQQSADAAHAAQPVSLAAVAGPDLTSSIDAHRKIRIEGQWLGERQFLWDNRSHNGWAGFEVITPFQSDEGPIVLVNRGWIPPMARRTVKPDVTLPNSALDTRQTITGLLSSPSRGIAQGDPLQDDDSWPRFLQYFDYEAIGEALGIEVVPAVVQVLDASVNRSARDSEEPLHPAVAQSDVSTRSADPALWYTPHWQPAASGPEKHYSYAFQWFAMAIGLTGVFLVVNARKRVTA